MLLAWVAAGASTSLGAAAVAASVAVSAGSPLATRLAWGAAAWGAPLLLTYLRDLLATRRPSPPLGGAVVLLAVGGLGWPQVMAVAVAAVLVARAWRQARRSSTGAAADPSAAAAAAGRAAV